MKRPKTLRLLGYARVSTEGQALGGVSLDAQVEAIGTWAKIHADKATVVEVRREQVSGTVKPMARPVLGAMLRQIERGQADGLCFLRLDRLSRSVTDVLDLATRAKRKGWHLASVYDPLDTTTAMGNFLLQLLAALAELEVGKIRERTRFGMRQVVRQGRIVSGVAPFGYRVGAPDGDWRPAARQRHPETGRKLGKPDMRPLVPCPAEQVILKRIVESVSGGMAAYSVAKRLNADGVRNPRTGAEWLPGSIQAIYRTARRRSDELAG